MPFKHFAASLIWIACCQQPPDRRERERRSVHTGHIQSGFHKLIDGWAYECSASTWNPNEILWCDRQKSGEQMTSMYRGRKNGLQPKKDRGRSKPFFRALYFNRHLLALKGSFLYLSTNTGCWKHGLIASTFCEAVSGVA